MLIKFNLTRKEKIDNFEAFYDTKTNPEYDEINHIISRDKCYKIIEYLEGREEGCTKYQLGKDLRMHPNTITKYINKIDEYGLLISIEQSNKVLYTLDANKYLEITRN